MREKDKEEEISNRDERKKWSGNPRGRSKGRKIKRRKMRKSKREIKSKRRKFKR